MARKQNQTGPLDPTKQRYELVPVRRLHEHPENPRRGNVDTIRESMEANGFFGALVVQRSTRRVLAGNHRLRVALAQGVAELPVIWVDVDDAQARKIMLADNATSDRATYDYPSLAEVVRSVIGKADTDDAIAAALLGTGYSPDQANDVLARAIGEASKPKTEAEDEATLDLTPPKKAKSEPGTLYRLGRHSLFCGDMTHADTLPALLGERRADAVFTDPPYAIYGSSTGIASDITDDKMVRPFFAQIIRTCAAALKAFGHVYVCCDWRSWSSWWEVSKGTGIVTKQMIVWDKGGAGLGSNYANTHELVYFGAYIPQRDRMTQKIVGQRMVHDSNIWRIGRVGAAGTAQGREHNAQKPVELVQRALKNSTDEGEAVIDFFGGSGTTMIAAEQLGREAFLVEIDPRYCDLIRRRFADLINDPKLAP